MMGGEENGLGRYLRRHASHAVTIAAACPRDEVGVDSLNVSVAAALLCDAFLRKSNEGQSKAHEDVGERVY